VPDTTPPTVNSPVVTPRRASVVTSLPVTVSWTSSDVGSGIVATELHTSVDGGAWRAVKLASATGSSVNTSMPTSGSVRYRVRVRDAAGNWSPWRYSVSLKGRLYQESYRWIRWSGSWSSRASSDWSGGAARVSVSPNSYSVFSFTGRSVAWVARTGPTMGLVRVSVDGVHAATVDLYSPTPGYRSVRYSQTWATSATHQLTLRNMATPGRPATEVDALIVLH
jgi:hypothetical protein